MSRNLLKPDNRSTLRRFVAPIAAFLLGTVLIGILLRGRLAGLWTGIQPYAYVRHAHMHLGVYGVLVPLVWWGWAKIWQPSRWFWLSYSVAVAVASAAFWQSGYGAVAITSSTWVLGAWVVSVWNVRAQTRRLVHRDWISASVVAMLGVILLVPAVAVTAGPLPVLAEQLVRLFVGLTLFGAVLPVQLHALSFPPLRGWQWLLAATLAATGFAFAGSGNTKLLALPIGMLLAAIAVARWRDCFGDAVAASWSAAGIALVGWSLDLLPDAPTILVAGLHGLILGPVLLSALAMVTDNAGRTVAAWGYLCTTAVFTSAVAAPAVGVAHLTAERFAVGSAGLLFLLLGWAAVQTVRKVGDRDGEPTA